MCIAGFLGREILYVYGDLRLKLRDLKHEKNFHSKSEGASCRLSGSISAQSIKSRTFLHTSCSGLASKVLSEV